MNANQKITPVLINGLKSSGKTTIINGLIKLFQTKNQNFAGFKPFDIGLMRRNANEQFSDGELYSTVMTGEPLQTLISPYIAHEYYPVEMAFRRDGISINEQFLKDRLKTLDDNYSGILLEGPGSLFEPITEKKQYYEWMLSKSNNVIWIMDLNHDQFTHNLAELNLLKTLDCNITLIFNNCHKNQDQDLMFYLWEKMESSLEMQAAGMIPFVSEIYENIDVLADKIGENIAPVVDNLLSS